MSKMRDSGVEWIGQIPKDWELVQTKRHFRNIKRVVGEAVDLYERLALTMNGVIKRSKEDSDGLQPEKFEGYQILKTNELVFKLIDLENIKTSRVGLSPYTGLVSPAYIVLTNNYEDNRYFYYWFMFMYYNEIFNHLGGDGVRSSLNAKDLLSIPVPNINNNLQKRIANYLDNKCSKIDDLIKKQQMTIEKLKEYKTSVISETVTKGLNANVKTKKAKIDWCEQIPNCWEIQQIRHLFQLRDEKNYKPLEEVQLLSLYTDLGVFPHGEQEERGNKAVKAEGYKVVYEDDIVVNIILAWMGAIGRSAYDGVTSPAYDIYKPIKCVCSKYYHYLFRTKVFSGECYKYGRGIMAMRWRTYSSEFKSIKVPVPPYEEQKEIAKYLDNKCEAIERIINDRKQMIEKLYDYKKSLIYEVVTGKRKI